MRTSVLTTVLVGHEVKENAGPALFAGLSRRTWSTSETAGSSGGRQK